VRRGGADLGGSPKHRSLLGRLRREVLEHPAETFALLAMGVAVARLVLGQERASTISTRQEGRRKQLIIPIGLMAALCMTALSSCAVFSGGVIQVEPDPATFGREYDYDLVGAGRSLAQRECASCHAIDAMTVSPNPSAPPLNAVLTHRTSDRLTDDLVAGIHVRNGAMPTFDFNVVAANSLTAYLESIQR
jgi:mono/diheme cytochrome c family protein